MPPEHGDLNAASRDANVSFLPLLDTNYIVHSTENTKRPNETENKQKINSFLQGGETDREKMTLQLLLP
jgi:hypothetical protein